MIRYLFAFLLLCGLVPVQAQTGAALPSGYLSVSGNQIQSNLGVNVRLACASFRGAPNDGTMAAIRTMGQFNCIRIDWRDAYTAASTPTFDDEFNTTQSWLNHATWQTNDPFGFIIAGDQGGTAQGPTYWTNPIDTPTTASVYGNANNALNLSLIKTPTGSGITQTTVGALINDQETPGGAGPMLFRYVTFSVAVPAVPGVLWQWDEEPADGTTEIDLDIWTDGSNIQHVKFWSQAGSAPVWYTTTSLDITQQNVYAIDWESNSITLYINGTQVAQTANPGGNYLTDPMFDYILTSNATYFGLGPAPNTANLPATVNLDYFRVYPSNPNGGVVAPSGCNSLTQIDGCVANATSAGLAVVLNHIGNEAPIGASNPCIGRQQNGLWFDSNPSIGVTDDGCGDGGNYTYSAFKADTVALLQRYAGNSTVIGYQFHNDPIVLAGSGGGTSGQAACTAAPAADSCSLNQTQLNSLASAIQTTQQSQVPMGECFAGPTNCHPQNFRVGDTILTTQVNVIGANPAPVSLTDHNGDIWTLQPNQSCDTNPPDWWWAGMAKNGVQQWCGYSIAIRLISGDVWVEEAKQGGWWDMTAAGGVIGNVPIPAGFVADPGPGVNNSISGSSGGSGTFSVNSSGQIIDPNGNVWVARGVSVGIADALAGTTGGASLSALQALAPRLNYVRVWGDYTQWTPSDLNTWIKSLTDVGIAFSIEDYTGNGPCRSGSDLRNANAWYNTAANFFASNPGVVFESQNECFDSSGGQPSRDQINSNYYAVHTAPAWAANTSYIQFQFIGSNGNAYESEGNCTSGSSGPSGTGTGIVDGSCRWDYTSATGGAPRSLFLIGSAGGDPTQGNGAWYFSNTNLLFKPMTNIAFDIHIYPGIFNDNGVATNQTAYNSFLLGLVQAFGAWFTDTESKIPVVTGEDGNCGNTGACNSNNTPEANWQLAVHADAQVSTAGVQGGSSAAGSAGVAYWKWECCDDSNVDILVNSGSATNPYGVQAFADLAGMPGTGPTPFTGGGGSGSSAPLVNWAGGGPTDIEAACSDVGAAVNAINSGVIEFCPGPINNSATLLNGVTKP